MSTLLTLQQLAAVAGDLPSGLVGWAAESPGNLPSPGSVDLPGSLNTKLGTIMGWALRLIYVACFLGFVLAGGKIIQSYMQSNQLQFGGVGAVAVACLIAGSAGALSDALIF